MIVEVVPAALDGERLDRFVAMVADCSRSQATALISDGSVLVEDEPAMSRSRRLAEGERVVLTAEPTAPDTVPEGEAGIEFDVVYEDEDLLVVDKPAGLVVHPGAGHPNGTLVNGLLARYPELSTVGERHRPGIVHRLDIGTTGLLLVARSAMAYDALVGALAQRRVHRHYLTLVWGLVSADEGVVDAAIGRSPRDSLKMAVVAEGRLAKTRYRVLDRVDDPGITWVRCGLETGRTHQIRVHLAAIGHPVVGDGRYGGARGRLPFDRPALHAAELDLAHPIDGRSLRFTADIPADLAGLLQRVGLGVS